MATINKSRIIRHLPGERIFRWIIVETFAHGSLVVKCTEITGFIFWYRQIGIDIVQIPFEWFTVQLFAQLFASSNVYCGYWI